MDFIKHKWLVIGIWIIIALASVPALMNYSSYISYSTSSSGVSNYESTKAQELLSSAYPQNESLILVTFQPQNMSQARFANITLEFQTELANAKIANFSKSESGFSAYASFLNNILKNSTPIVRSAYANFTLAAENVYSFPHSFLMNWRSINYSSISEAIQMSNYAATPFEKNFVAILNLTYSPNSDKAMLVQNATAAAVLATGNLDPYTLSVLKYLNVTNYETSELRGFSLLINSTGHPLAIDLLQSMLRSGDPGTNYVESYGLKGVPSFIKEQFVSPDSSTYLVRIIFDVPSGYIGRGGSTPAQIATPTIRSEAIKYFGSNAELTGDGAIAYDTQSLTSSSGIIFAFTFIFLAISVAITLRSYLAPLLTFVFVSISTLLGYVSIFLTGAFLFRVNFIVTYTLTAVLLGVATDYLVFLLHRYREELRNGIERDEAIRLASKNAGTAILVSGLTVAASLGTFSFISGLQSWGPVLFMGVIFTVALELTLLPAVAAVIGPRLFLKRSLNKLQNFDRSFFYRAANFSITRKKSVIFVIVILALPAIYLWFTVPTSYNFNEGLPQNLQSVRALNTVENSFGANLIYPNYVIVNLTGQIFSGNGSLTENAINQLVSYYDRLISYPGVTKVIGPVSSENGSNQYALASSFIFGSHAYFMVYDNYSPYSAQAIELVKQLRSNSSFLVGGLTSSIIDQQTYSSMVYTQLEILIVIAIALIIGISFKSLKYPFIALSGVFISISWTTSLLYLVTKFLLNEELLYLIPLILFVILMSLGNDYTVFIISRVREYQKMNGFKEGILRGMSGSAGVVTSLGIILAVSLGSLGLAPISFLRQLGLAFVISLLLDTFIIRTFYFPSMIHLMRVGDKKSDRA
jgi:RND superfamily putative drug exporter